MIDAQSWRSKNEDTTAEQLELEKAHEMAIKDVFEVINDQIIDKQRVFKLTELCLLYIQTLEKTKYKNNEYRSEKLKNKLEKHFDGKIGFIKIKQTSKFQSHLVYSTSINLSNAIESAYSLGNADNIADVRYKLRSNILDSFSSVENNYLYLNEN